jgi:hypothetical protein
MNSQLKLYKFGAFLFAFIVFVISAPSVGRSDTAQLPPKFIHHFPNGDRFTIFFEPEVVVLQQNSQNGEARTYEIMSNRRILAALANNPDYSAQPLYKSSYRALTGVGRNRSEINIWSNRFFKTDLSFILTDQYLYLFNDRGEHTIIPLETFCRGCYCAGWWCY